jgi:hypothetical protein
MSFFHCPTSSEEAQWSESSECLTQWWYWNFCFGNEKWTTDPSLAKVSTSSSRLNATWDPERRNLFRLDRTHRPWCYPPCHKGRQNCFAIRPSETYYSSSRIGFVNRFTLFLLIANTNFVLSGLANNPSLYCHVCVWLQTGYRLVNGFIDHLYTPFETTSNYSAIANIHTLQITTAHAQHFSSLLCHQPFPSNGF